MARQKAQFPIRICEKCGVAYTPNGPTQRFCKPCANIAKRERGTAWWRKNHPNAVCRTTEKPPCCECGEPSVASINGKRYCNKHWLRMYVNGTTELKGRKNTSTFTIEGRTLRIKTSGGDTILADADDYETLSRHSWCISKTGYAVSRIGGKVVKMHRLIMGNINPQMVVDHINHDRLDNRKENLRVCTALENSKNNSGRTSRKLHRGVRLTKSGKYSACIMVNRKAIRIGTYDTEAEAIKAREDAEVFYNGEFAACKTPKGGLGKCGS